MIAVDTNILVYSHREDSAFHLQALARVRELAEGRKAWAIPWPCVHEFLSIATHPRIYSPPSPLAAALDQVDAWLESPTLVMLGEEFGYWSLLKNALKKGKVIGPRVHDARIASICHSHGVSELWTADRDFSYFPAIVSRNPLIGE